ncbi:MAG: methyltransferase [Alphaproteobacteria bacterium]|nr:methyltransferase [Alphaproteobacteria bacterium]
MNFIENNSFHYDGIQKSFEKALYTYDHEAIIQLQASQYLIHSVVSISSYHQKVMDLGCGSGLVTSNLCNALCFDSLHLNDLSPLLLEKAYHRLGFFKPNALLFNFDKPWDCYETYDLIFSNMAFQWSFDIQALFDECFSHLTRAGLLAFSLPLKGTFFKLDPSQMIQFHSFDDIKNTLKAKGFKVIRAQKYLLEKEHKTQLNALRSIKRSGAHYVPYAISSKRLQRSKLLLPSTLTYTIGTFIAKRD